MFIPSVFLCCIVPIGCYFSEIRNGQVESHDSSPCKSILMENSFVLLPSTRKLPERLACVILLFLVPLSNHQQKKDFTDLSDLAKGTVSSNWLVPVYSSNLTQSGVFEKEIPSLEVVQNSASWLPSAYPSLLPLLFGYWGPLSCQPVNTDVPKVPPQISFLCCLYSFSWWILPSSQMFSLVFH